MNAKKTFLEFFAGGGMARIGLGRSWRCLLANDLDSQKCASYRANFGGDHLIEGDIASITLDDLPSHAVDLVWGSFPCQDLSLAGARGGMGARRSGAFFPFWSLMEGLIAADKAPRMIAIENVAGLLTSNDGRDFACVVDLMAKAGYVVTAAILDAKNFTPQSRPRLFILGFAEDLAPPKAPAPLSEEIAPPALVAAQTKLSKLAQARWFWLGATPRLMRNARLSSLIDWDAPDWHPAEQTQKLVAMMAPHQRERLEAIVKNGAKRAGAAFRRTRIVNGETVQRVEARFDGLAGCLRTPAGGSSRQIVFAIENGKVRSRLISAREAAGLMGLPEDYILPHSANAALKLCGDGVAVPVVRWLAETVFEPALTHAKACKAA